MFILSWARLPSSWIRAGLLKDYFSSNIELAKKIAALKIYIIFCIKANKCSEIDYSCSMTYDELIESVSLSRSSIHKGLQHLISLGLIKGEGIRTKKYFILNLNKSGWCKIPVSGFISDYGVIESFKMFHNRYAHELNSLKLYLYLLSIRDNEERFSEVSFRKITIKTGIKHSEIKPALSFLNIIGLLEKSFVVLSESSSISKTEVVARYYMSNSSNLVKRDRAFV